MPKLGSRTIRRNYTWSATADPFERNDEDALTRAIIALATQYCRYGYRRITIKLKEAGWNVGKDHVERISTPRTKT